MLCHYVTKNGEMKNDLNLIGCLRAEGRRKMLDVRGKKEE